jgi:threonine dehydrogenase-like Zn-dependent dehydrogenase
MSAIPLTQHPATRAAIFHGGAEVTHIATHAAYPAGGHVRVRMEGCGVCASNLPVWEGRPWFKYPFPAGAPGHEGWGRVDAVGEGVEDLDVGDRVAMVSGNAYAQHDTADAASVVKLPSSLGDRPFPGEPLGCVMNIFRRSDIRAGQTVAIVGIGFLGAALTALAVNAGARVLAFSRRDFALEMAEHYGASVRVRLADPSHDLREARRLRNATECERVIEAVGTQQALDLASELASVRGRLVIAGYHQDGPRSVNLQHWNWLGLDVINAHERDPAQYRQGMQEAVELIANGRFDPTPLYTHQFPLEDISAAFRTLSERPHGFLKALIVCG